MGLYPKKGVTEFEKLATNDLLNSTIEEVQWEEKHEFKYTDEKTRRAHTSVHEAIRLKFAIEGYNYHHYSRWMRLNAGEKSNLYNKVLAPLVEGAYPDMMFDVKQLEGMKVKTLWVENKGYQNLANILPREGKLKPVLAETPTETDLADVTEELDEEVPF